MDERAGRARDRYFDAQAVHTASASRVVFSTLLVARNGGDAEKIDLWVTCRKDDNSVIMGCTVSHAVNIASCSPNATSLSGTRLSVVGAGAITYDTMTLRNDPTGLVRRNLPTSPGQRAPTLGVFPAACHLRSGVRRADTCRHGREG